MASRISKSSIVVADKDQVSRDLGENVIILNLKSGMYYALDSVGGRIWDLIQTPIAIERILDVMIEEYDVDLDSCTNDLLLLLQKLEDSGVMELLDDEMPT